MTAVRDGSVGPMAMVGMDRLVKTEDAHLVAVFRNLGLEWYRSVHWDDPARLLQADEYCRRYAAGHTENFRVASLLLPRGVRRHFYRLYAYCRGADDLADQVVDPSASIALLAWWQSQLLACYDGVCEHPLFAALRDTIREYSLPAQPFLDLLIAFRRDQTQHEYASFEDLLSYCRCSANPVGRLILGIARSTSEENIQMSDSLCTGLQLVNFCQDIARDAQRGRIYVPRESREAFGYTDQMWAGRQVNRQFRNLVRFEVDRAESYLRAGRPLMHQVPGAFRWQIGLFAEGGLAVVRAIRRYDYDVWSTRPVVGRFGKLSVVRRAFTQRYGWARWNVN